MLEGPHFYFVGTFKCLLRVVAHRSQNVFSFEICFKLVVNAVKCHCHCGTVCTQVEREGMCGILPVELIDVPIGAVKASNKQCAYFKI